MGKASLGIEANEKSKQNTNLTIYMAKFLMSIGGMPT